MSMYYELTGPKNAPTVILIHGGGISGWMWHYQTKALRVSYRCIVPDLPEHGKSGKEGTLSIRDCAARIHSMIEETDNGAPVHMIGHSIGAKIIVQYLSDYPKEIESAIIISALFRPMPLLKLSMNRTTYRMTERMLRHPSVLKMQINQFGFPLEEDRARLADDFRNLTADAMDHLYGELYRNLTIPDLSSVSTRCLVIAGEKEPRAMRDSATDLADALPNAKAELFGNCRHDIPWHAPDRLNEAVKEWINKKDK